MPRKSIGETAMTNAERQARYRAARAAGAPVIRMHRPVLQQSATADALRAICDLDLGELQAVIPPRGFGRD